MSYLYVNEQGAVITVNGGRIEVKTKEGMLKSIPIETLEVIQVWSRRTVVYTCQCKSDKTYGELFFRNGYSVI